MSRELPQNPNTRKPYSDVQIEVDVHVRGLIEVLVGQLHVTDELHRRIINRRIRVAERALLRVRAVLDPITLSDEDWENTKQSAHALSVELHDTEVIEEDTPEGRVARFLKSKRSPRKDV
jgi:hypothetical protein